MQVLRAPFLQVSILSYFDEAFKQAGLDIVPEVSEADITSPDDISLSSRLARI